MYGRKISKLHIIWEGEHFKHLDITVDLAICFKDSITKKQRHCDVPDEYIRNPVTHHVKEQRMISNLPKHMRNGFILAKAVRIASIAKPDNIESFELQETINTDDVISSFILKACLFEKDKMKDEFYACSKPVEAAIPIYELLQNYLSEKNVRSEYSYEEPVNCTMCKFERGCCKRRKLMLAMVEKILQWLEDYKDKLQSIDFADDVKLFETNE